MEFHYLLLLLFFFPVLLAQSQPHEINPSPTLSNITVIGTVFCDACSRNTFSNHSYFLQGVKVKIDCMFSVKLATSDRISIEIERITDKFGVYRLDIPPVDGFKCQEGRALESFCKASLVQSPSPLCNIPSLTTSTEHLGIKTRDSKACIYNLNALSYKPINKDVSCIKENEEAPSLVTIGPNNSNSALFFWPPFPPFCFPWMHWPPCHFPLPFPFPSPPSFPFPIPLPFPSPPSLPFPFPQIPFLTPPSTAFPFPPLPSFPPFPTFPPPSMFPFPLPPLPPFKSIPSLFPLPPSPPTPSFPFPFPPLLPPFFPFPGPPAPPSTRSQKINQQP